MNKLLKIIIVCVMLSFFYSISIYAHDSNLGIIGYDNIYYDECDPISPYVDSNNIGDGYFERWYNLEWGSYNINDNPCIFNCDKMRHIDDDIETIYY